MYCWKAYSSRPLSASIFVPNSSYALTNRELLCSSQSRHSTWDWFWICSLPHNGRMQYILSMVLQQQSLKDRFFALHVVLKALIEATLDKPGSWHRQLNASHGMFIVSMLLSLIQKIKQYHNGIHREKGIFISGHVPSLFLLSLHQKCTIRFHPSVKHISAALLYNIFPYI